MKKYLLPLSLLIMGQAHAQALLSNDCPVTAKIKRPTNASNVYMSKDCKTAYVLPPEVGTVKLVGFSQSANLTMCASLDAAMKNLNEINARITSAKIGANQTTPDIGLGGGLPGGLGGIGGLGGYGQTPVEADPLSEEELVELYLERKEIAEDIINEYGQMSGVIAQLNYSTGYSELLKEFEKKNKDLGIAFQGLPLKNTRFNFSSPNFSAALHSMAISTGMAIKQDQMMNGSASGSVELSLLGACPLRNRLSGKLDERLSTKKFSSLLIANLSYEYELITTVSYKAEYSKGGMAEKIRKSSTKGGFFKTSTTSKLITSASSESWFDYYYSCDDSRACEEAHQENILDIKKRLMDEVLANISLVKIGYELTPEAAGTPGRNGASASAEALRKCQHVYCQAGAAVLDIANSTFGGTNKYDSYVNKEQHRTVETSETKKPFSYHGSMGFAPKE